MNTRSARITRAALCPILGISLLSLAVAQTAPTNPSSTSGVVDVTLEKFVVTGSNIPMAADAAAVPVTILGRADLESTGLDTNLLEVLQKRMPIFAGNGNLGVTNSNVGANSTAGGSQVSLRNLSTLVLLNGRRLPDNGSNARGGRRFVDVNQIPLAAVQSVEVLTDGASAIYGSDAVGGVVNIKLRSDFNGLEAGGRYAWSDRKGDYEEKSGYIVAGAKRPGIGLTVAGTWSSLTPLYQADRPFSTPIVGRTATISGAVSPTSANFPTNFLRSDLVSPSRAVPTGTAATAADLAALQASGIYPASAFQPIADTFDLSPLVTLILESEKKAASVNGAITIVPDLLEFFVEGLYSKSDSFSQLAAQPVTATVPVNSPYNPTRSSIFAAFRYVPAPRQFVNQAELQRIVGGVRGKFLKNYQWEIGYNHGENKLTNQVRNVLYNPNLQLGLAGGYDAAGNAVVGGRFARVFRDFNAPGGLTTLAQWQAAVTPANTILQPAFDVFARPAGVDPLSIANIFGASSLEFISTLKGFDGRVAGNVWELPGGDLGAAVGFTHNKEILQGEPDANSRSSGPTAQRWNGATFFDPFTKDRDIEAFFAEVRVPIFGEKNSIPGFRVLELSAAYRYEDYSDAGTSKVPKYGIRWRPIGDDLTVRATYSEAFTAPSLFSLFGPTTQGFTATAVIPNVFGVNGQAQARGGSNSTLKPATAETYSIGAVYSPKAIKGLTVSVDYISIDEVELVGSAGSTEILRSVDLLGTGSPYISQIAFDNWPTNPDPLRPAARPITAPGQLGAYIRGGSSANNIFLTDSNINIAGQKVKAVDVAVNYELPWRDYGRFNVGTTGTFFLDYQFQALPSQRYYEYAGHVTNGGTGAQGVVPGMRWFTTLSWSQGPWSAMFANTYIDEITDIGPGGITFETSTALRRRPVEAYSSTDGAVSYTFSRNAGNAGFRRFMGGLKVSLGVNNISDEMPPLSPQAFNESNADVSTYNPIGRLWYVQAQFKF
jgi:iron complex outermembrane receptor protein